MEPSKTPKFNNAINIILENLKPHKRICEQCDLEFEFLNTDIEFFNKFKVPPPRMCPDCRRQRRLAFVNYTTLFKRSCNTPTHNEKIISSIPEETEFPVYDFDSYWHGDRDWKEYGKDFDFDKSFINQFRELFIKSPQPALTRNPESVDSEYTSYGIQLKNCYYVFGGMNAENIMYTVWPMRVKDSIDLLIAVNTDLSYECVYPENCYNCNFVYFSRDCLDCNFIFDCRNCNDCFACVNLRSKKYCIWNKQYSKEDYFREISKIDLGNQETLKKYKLDFMSFVKKLPVRATRNEHSENISGNYLINTKNCFSTMWAMNSENLNFTDFVLRLKDSYDCTVSAVAEKLYSTSGVGNNCFDVKFSTFGRDVRECEYTMNCKNCTNCFACIGLVNAKFCVFNKQYEENEYWNLVDEIKTKMLKDNEYGEFFPMSISPFPYNASLSNIIYPSSKEKILELNGWWYDEKSDFPKGIEFIKINDIEKNIKDISDVILNKGIISDDNGKPFRITERELDFYKRKQISIPNLTPYERIINRFSFVNNFNVFKDKCFKCKTEILSSYDTKNGFKPYCEKCYQQEVY